MNFLFLLAGLLVGAAVAWFFQESRRAGSLARAKALDDGLTAARAELAAERAASSEAATRAAGAEERARGLAVQLDTQRAELDEAHRKLEKDFELLANRILEEKTARFTETNRVNLDALLGPLSQKLGEFKTEVHSARLADTRDRATLQEQIRALSENAQRMSTEANHLANALKGQTKVQGNWGELILETVLQSCGLLRDEHYRTQVNLPGEDGRRYQPDVIVDLPGGKHLIVDSKVSLTAYERWCRAHADGCTADPREREAALRGHLDSLRQHIGGLSAKRYHALPDVHTIELVLMFIPIEPAFALAMGADDGLLTEAHEKNVCLVTPCTLLLALKTVASIWRQEKQTRNAIEIAQRGGDLIDKFAGFCEDLRGVGDRLTQARTSYDEAVNKLSTGKGNLIKRAEDLRKLGVKASKTLPAAWVSSASGENGVGEPTGPPPQLSLLG